MKLPGFEVRSFAERIDLGAPGRVSLLHLVDGEDSVFLVVSIEMLIERHSDSSDFLTRITLDTCSAGNVLSNCSCFLAVSLLFVELSEDVEADAQ